MLVLVTSQSAVCFMQGGLCILGETIVRWMCNLDNQNNELKEAARRWILVSILINSVNLRSEKNVSFKQICTHNYIVLHSISEFYYLVPEIKWVFIFGCECDENDLSLTFFSSPELVAKIKILSAHLSLTLRKHPVYRERGPKQTFSHPACWTM